MKRINCNSCTGNSKKIRQWYAPWPLLESGMSRNPSPISRSTVETMILRWGISASCDIRRNVSSRVSSWRCSDLKIERHGFPLSSASSCIAAPKERGSRFTPARTARLVMEVPRSPTHPEWREVFIDFGDKLRSGCASVDAWHLLKCNNRRTRQPS